MQIWKVEEMQDNQGGPRLKKQFKMQKKSLKFFTMKMVYDCFVPKVVYCM